MSIPKETLEELINYDVPAFYTEVLALLSSTDINLYRNFTLTHDNEKIALNPEWVLYTFNIADERTQEYFITQLKKAITEQSDISAHLQHMAQLALNASRS